MHAVPCHAARTLADTVLVLFQAGFDVLGGYLSPVNDAYWKQGLARGVHRVRMCQLATADSGAESGWVGGDVGEVVKEGWGGGGSLSDRIPGTPFACFWQDCTQHMVAVRLLGFLTCVLV